jgi:hypothetical protein
MIALDVAIFVCAFSIFVYGLLTLNRMTKHTSEWPRLAVLALTTGAFCKALLIGVLLWPISWMQGYMWLDKLWVIGVTLFILLNRRTPRC